MRRKRRIERHRVRGRRIPYVFKNRLYLGKRPQKGPGVVSRVVAELLKNVGSVIGI